MIEATAISRAFGAIKAANDVTLKVAEGEVVALAGS